MLKFRRIFYIFSIALVCVSIIGIALFGLNLGIDFTGGTLMEIKIGDGSASAVTALQIEQLLEINKDLKLGDVRVQPTGNNFLIRLKEVNEQQREEILKALQDEIKSPLTQERFESIGPIIGRELKRKALWQLTAVCIGILLFVAWAFRKVSNLKEKSNLSWKFGAVALVALVHDCLITIGTFALLGKFLGVEIDSSFIAAILLVLGYSVNDTIVVFDRIRENMIAHRLAYKLEDIINISVAQTSVRSLTTSATTIVVLFAILLFGGQSTFYFVLALIIGIGIGTYSSIFLASPLLYEWEKAKN
jgi:preprotein translocase subunit SecF